WMVAEVGAERGACWCSVARAADNLAARVGTGGDGVDLAEGVEEDGRPAVAGLVEEIGQGPALPRLAVVVGGVAAHDGGFVATDTVEVDAGGIVDGLGIVVVVGASFFERNAGEEGDAI